jgi:AsnC-type helix-turn-helix domain
MNSSTLPATGAAIRLDDLDHRILDELSRDGRLSNTDLAHRIGLSSVGVLDTRARSRGERGDQGLYGDHRSRRRRHARDDRRRSDAVDTHSAGQILRVGGEAEVTGSFDLDDLFRTTPLEERIYRFRCVEAWSMVVPWVGFPPSGAIAPGNASPHRPPFHANPSQSQYGRASYRQYPPGT